MLQRNSNFAFTAPHAIEALVQDLSLPNSEWGFELSNCKATYFVHHGMTDALRPIEESKFVAQHLINATAVHTHFHPNTGHSLHLFQPMWASLLDQIIGVEVPATSAAATKANAKK